MSERERDGVTRRTMLRLGLLAAALPGASAIALPDASAQGTKPGAHLIGKLEGPEVVLDPAQFPKSFKEAPPLAELVKAGKLPPVQERIGQDPLVVKPLREIGKYGGTRRGRLPGRVPTPHGPPPAHHDQLLLFGLTGTRLLPQHPPCLGA